MTAILSGYHETIEIRRQRVIGLTQLGHSAREISTQLGITTRQVVRIRVAAGIAQPKPQPLTDDEIRIAADLLEDGCSYAEVARTIGRSPVSIRKHFPGRGWDRGEGAHLGALRRWIQRRAPELEGL